MLEQLDKVDWASMNHAYGSAADVPEMIRAIASDDEAIREEAFYTAYGNIYHQGTRYEATAPAVPFLLEILEQPAYESAVELMGLLAHLVMGGSSTYLPFGFLDEIIGMREDLADLEARPTEERAEDETDDLGWGTDEDWLRWTVNITDEVRKGVPRFIRLLTFDDPSVRIAAAFVLSWLPEDAELFGPALWAVASSDENDYVRANALIALTIASTEDDFAEYVPEVQGMLLDAEPIVQFAAAVALGTHAPDDAPDAVVQILLDAVARAASEDADDEEAGEDWYIPWTDDDVGSLASAVLTVVCADDPKRIVEAISTALPNMHLTQACNAAGTVLMLLFPDGFDSDDTADLEPLQRGFLELLCEVPTPWMLGNFTMMMSEFGLPSSVEDLREFLNQPRG